jgi:hypothetical protein
LSDLLFVGLPSCLNFDLRLTTVRVSNITNATQVQIIESRINALNIPKLLSENPPILSMEADINKIRSCNQTAVEIWKDYVAAASNASEPEDMKKLREQQLNRGFQQSTREAVHRLVKGFQVARVPLALSSGLA